MVVKAISRILNDSASRGISGSPVSLAAGPDQGNLSPQPFIPLPCPTEGRRGVGGGDKRAESPTRYVIEYPNGVIIRISGSLEVEFLCRLILGNEG
jgi:hypothetical protein